MTLRTGHDDQPVMLDTTGETSPADMCLGMHLARLETRVMLNSMFDLVKDLALVADDGSGEE